MLISMAEFEKEKVVTALNSFQEAMGIMPSLTTVAVMPNVIIPKLGGEQQRRRLAIKTAKKIARQVKKEKQFDSMH